MIRKSFPRGGKKPLSSKPPEVGLFKKNKKPRKHKSENKRSQNGTNEETGLVPISADWLSRFSLHEGLRVLGCVHRATDVELVISIPGGMLGHVKVTDISEVYTNLLQTVIKSETDQPNEFKPLPELYKPGDYVVCIIKELQGNEKKDICLSLNPNLINQMVNVHNLVKGLKLVCVITSEEDHGYVVDSGIPNVRAFIPNKGLDDKTVYGIGKQLLCSIKEIKTVEGTATVQLYAGEKYANATCTVEIEALDALVPGMKLPLEVTKILRNGLQVKFANNQIGVINQMYLDRRANSYIVGMEVFGILLYIMPTEKFAYFSLQTGKPKPPILNIGDIIPDGIFLHRESNGLVLQLSENGARGFVSLRRTGVDFANISDFVAGNKYKCRILSYNWMERIYMCTMEKNLINRRYFSLSDFKVGDVTTVKIRSITESKFVNVCVESIRGYVAPEHVSDNGTSYLKKLKPEMSVHARVLGIETDRNHLRFTLKHSLIHSTLPILCKNSEAQLGQKYHGTIVQINKNGLLVRFFDEAKGWVPQNVLDRTMASVNWNYSVGQTVTVQVDSVNPRDGKMMLRIAMESRTNVEGTQFEIGQLLDGTVTESSVHGVHVKLSDERNGCTGFLPAGLLSSCMEVGTRLASRYTPGDTIRSAVFSVTPILILTRADFQFDDYKDFDKLKIGDCIPCLIRDITPEGLRVILPITNYTRFGFVRFSNVSNYNDIQENQCQMAKITSINRKEKDLGLTMLLKKMFEDGPSFSVRMSMTIEILTHYLSTNFELSQFPYYENKPISSVVLGQKVTGEIEKVTEDGLLVVRLTGGVQGIVRKDHYSGSPKVGDTVHGSVMWIDYVQEFVDITLNPVTMNSINAKQNKIPDLPVAVPLRAEILMITSWFVLILIKGSAKGCLAALPVRRHPNDSQPDLTPYTVGSRIRCFAMAERSETGIMPVCILKSTFDTSRFYVHDELGKKETNRKRQTKNIEKNERPAKKLKKKEKERPTTKMTEQKDEEEENEDTEEEQEDMEEEQEDMEEEQEDMEEEQEEMEDLDTHEIESVKSEPEVNQTRNVNEFCRNRAKAFAVPECGFSWDDGAAQTAAPAVESSSGSDSESEEQSEQKKKKKKKLNASERRELERQKERTIREKEEALAKNRFPNSVDQFDRLVLASPNSSLVWLQYVAHHLEATEIEKARAVARRARNTINFREEREKLNIWFASLNLESKFGTPESLNEVFQEAVRTNDAVKVYTHMLSVHVEARRPEALEKIVNTMISKFKKDPQIWIECIKAFLMLGLREKARHIFQRGLKSLPEFEHVNLTVKTAHLEDYYGDKERFQTLFEQILSSYPKRVDIWSSYVDSLVKSGDIDGARRVLDRSVVQTLPPRKMGTLFKKFLSFEQQHGTEEDVARVRQLAADYVEKTSTKITM